MEQATFGRERSLHIPMKWSFFEECQAGGSGQTSHRWIPVSGLILLHLLQQFMFS